MDQKTLDALLAKVIAQARQAGIPVSPAIDPKVRVNRRARTRFGCCIQKNGRFYIELYGYGVERTDSFEKLGLEDQRPVKYLVVCQSCGRQLPRMKRSPLVEHPERYRCSCGGALRVVEVHEDPRP